jgi:uncharacterized protein (TIGR03663 family)
MNNKAFAGLFLLILIGAAAFRLIDLGARPMHHDEANQALKFGALLEKGEYRYDKADHHGPSLYYLSLPLARILGRDTLAALDERTLRLVPAGFGLGAILLLLLLIPLMGKESVLWSALGLALSPVMVYFSRFYIQETLLLFFLVGFIACVWRYRLKPSWGWAAAAGGFAGMMVATKETAVIAFGSIAAALFLGSLLRREKRRDRPALGKPGSEGAGKRFGADLLAGLGTAILVSVLLFTSFFKNSRGFIDSILSFKVYFVRAAEAGFHVQPWPYYLQKLAFSKTGSGPLWSEGLILILAAAGIVAGFVLPSNKTNRSFLIFLSFYAVASTAAYSLIPYKTPWNVLPFYLGFILLAGPGAAALLRSFRSRPARAAVFLLLAAGFVHLGAQARRAGLVCPADPRNPYVYAQTSPGFLQLVRKVEDLAALHPDHEKMLIKVIAGPYETWPLPWYLRRFDRVGYWTTADRAGAVEEAAVIITDTEQAARLESALSISFQSEYYELRPGVFMVLHVRNDLWDEYLKSRTGR